jgi:polysaccharide pyruvyl transferase WcaK-like protein
LFSVSLSESIMLIQLKGGSFSNRGDQLMLIAVVDRFRAVAPHVALASHTWYGSYEERARLGLRHTLWAPKRTSLAGTLGRWFFRKYGRPFGIVAEEDAQAVLDLSGYCYGDCWGPGSTLRLPGRARAAHRRGQKMILLPQALGPFNDPRTARALAQAAEFIDLIFARDRESYAHMAATGADMSRVEISPDFTNLVSAAPWPEAAQLDPYACIVANERMLDKAPRHLAEKYVEFLASSITQCERRGLETLIVVHDVADDARIVGKLRTLLSRQPLVVDSPDPRVLKGVLGGAQVVIGSRYHALVGALSQGVPCIGTSWSHKYEALFDDYDCRDMLLNPDVSENVLCDRIDRAVDLQSHEELERGLRQRAWELQERAQAMWNKIFIRLGIEAPREVPDRHVAAVTRTLDTEKTPARPGK